MISRTISVKLYAIDSSVVYGVKRYSGDYILSQKDLTLESAYEIALSEETASRRASELQASVKTGATPDGDVQRLASGKPHNRGGSTKSCYRCGKSGHHPDRCIYRHQKCRACQEKGHIAKMCKNKGAPHGTPSPGGSPFDRVNKKFRSAGYVDIESGEQSEDNGSEDTQLFAISEPRYSPMVVKPTVDGVELKMELDTGATVSLASERVCLQEVPTKEVSDPPANVHWRAITSVGSADRHSGI